MLVKRADVETAGVAVPAEMLVGSGLVSGALPPTEAVPWGLVIGEFTVASLLVGLTAPGMVPPFDATQRANTAGGTTSTAIGM